MSLVIVDSGVANLASVIAAVKRLNVAAEISSDAGKIRAASHVILPGVGAAEAAMAQLEAKGLSDVIRGLTQPVLGICLGMQLLFSHSEEGRGCACLGVIQGEVNRLAAKQDMPIPHMGWNQIKACVPDHPLLRGVKDDSFVYFVHSFAAPVGGYTLASCDYSETFTAVAGCKNFFGCQFHPERSGSVGSQILKNFLDM
ncbi:MAG: imidazole glycerol phosphate synthase subunit HisH [Alphaproteobacteria bacterium]|nr:imidazole glycerol phosphate synthase subunit HisH [Alphaproteobacteria bacterium]